MYNNEISFQNNYCWCTDKKKSTIEFYPCTVTKIIAVNSEVDGKRKYCTGLQTPCRNPAMCKVKSARRQRDITKIYILLIFYFEKYLLFFYICAAYAQSDIHP